MIPLTPSNSLDVDALAGLFRKRTNSYKYLFFQSLQSILSFRKQNERIVDLETLAVEMAALAWYPHNYFRLSFGPQDQVGRVLDRLAFSPEGASVGSPKNQRALRASIRHQAATIDLHSLLRYVPYRLLEPFFEAELSGLKDQDKNERVRELAETRFESARPLYRIKNSTKGPAIELHPAWMAYLKSNHAIVSGWSDRQWLAFLQHRNPATPALTEKIRPPAQRSPLTSQTRFWNSILAEHPFRCLYSNKPLAPGEFVLDHFVPWAYVCHDRLWNLVPVRPEANSRKGHALPDPAYMHGLARIQSEGLTVFCRQVGRESDCFNHAADPFLVDLKLADHEIFDARAVIDAYKATLQPLLTLARQSGFPHGWRF